MRTVLFVCPECEVCHKASEVELEEVAFRGWQLGMHVQDAFPDMSRDDREVLISGTHPVCWDILMGPEE